MIKMARSLLTEYGVKWVFNRGIYSGKLKLMSKIPIAEKLFEKNVTVKRINVFDFNVVSISSFLNKLEDKKKTGIITVADIYDALTSSRIYHKADNEKTALGYLRRAVLRGELDKECVDTLCSVVNS
jgi:hypothetical protein